MILSLILIISLVLLFFVIQFCSGESPHGLGISTDLQG